MLHLYNMKLKDNRRHISQYFFLFKHQVYTLKYECKILWQFILFIYIRKFLHKVGTYRILLDPYRSWFSDFVMSQETTQFTYCYIMVWKFTSYNLMFIWKSVWVYLFKCNFTWTSLPLFINKNYGKFNFSSQQVFLFKKTIKTAFSSSIPSKC